MCILWYFCTMCGLTPSSICNSRESIKAGLYTSLCSLYSVQTDLLGTLRSATADRTAFAPGGLGLFACPFVSSAKSMSCPTAFAGDFAFLFNCHRSEATASTLFCLHISYSLSIHLIFVYHEHSSMVKLSMR